MVQSCVFSTLLYPQQCLHPPCCCINHCLSLHLLQPIDISQNSTGITSGCKSKNHAKWQRLWQYSYVIGVGGTNPQHISHISPFRSLNNSLISWFQFPFLQRLHWREYSQNLFSYLLLQIASQCSFVIGVAYKREGTMTEINVYRYISVKQRDDAICNWVNCFSFRPLLHQVLIEWRLNFSLIDWSPVLTSTCIVPS